MKPMTYYWQSLNFVSLALAPISLLFCLLVFLRRILYRFGWFKSYHSKLPVIVVGNIYIGGNGKTPFVIWLAKQLQAAGYHPGIVSRGYGALEHSSDFPWPREVGVSENMQLYGDEPFLIHQATQCPVIIDPDRSRAVKKIENISDCDVIISDDGLQHYAMSRLLEINITDARRLYGNGLCLPAGPLRESRQRLKSVDYIVYNISQSKLKTVGEKADGREFTMDYEVNSLLPLDNQDSLDFDDHSMTLDDFKGKIVHAVAGIGEPDNFFRLLECYGLIVIKHPFADHFQYQEADLDFEPSYPIIMTEKDAVKCRAFSLSQCWYLPIKANIDHILADHIIGRLNKYSTP